MNANQEQCFDTWIKIDVPVAGIKRDFMYDMKDPEYRGVY
jgi:hypothetical protein